MSYRNRSRVLWFVFVLTAIPYVANLCGYDLIIEYSSESRCWCALARGGLHVYREIPTPEIFDLAQVTYYFGPQPVRVVKIGPIIITVAEAALPMAWIPFNVDLDAALHGFSIPLLILLVPIVGVIGWRSYKRRCEHTDRLIDSVLEDE